jgi:pilin isopeptide linkage protein
MKRRQPSRLFNLAMSLVLVVGLLPSQAFAGVAPSTAAATTAAAASPATTETAPSSETPAAKTPAVKADATTPSTPAPSTSATPDAATTAPKESGSFKLVDVADITGSSVKVGDTQVTDGAQLAVGDVVSIHVEYTIGADKREVAAGDEFTYELPDCLDYSADGNSGTLRDGDTAVGTFSISGHTLKLHYDAAHAGDVAGQISVSGTIGGAGDKTLDLPGIGSYDVTVKDDGPAGDTATDTKADGDAADTGDEDASEDSSTASKDDAPTESLAGVLGVLDTPSATANKIGGIFSTITTQSDPVAITSANAKATLGLYTDSSCTTPVGTVDRGQSLYGDIAITYTTPPTSSDNVRAYTMPAGVTLTGSAAGATSGTLYGSDGTTVAGTWAISGGTITFTYNAAWLQSHSSEVQTNFRFAFTLDSAETSGKTSQTYSFPAVAAPVTVTFNDGEVTGSKDQTIDADGNATFTITLNATSDLTNFSLDDTLGSDWTFDANSFTLDGTSPTVAVNGQKATVSATTISKGTHTITYKAALSETGKAEALANNGKLLDANRKNYAAWTWTGESKTAGGSNTTSWPNVNYSYVNKYDGSKGDDNTVNWTVKINDGAQKADVSNYVFADTIAAGQTYAAGTKATIKNSSGTTVGTVDLDSSASTFTYTLPTNAGKDTYTITYSTTITSPDTASTLSNTATVTPPGGKGISDTGTYVNPGKDSDYISKEVTTNDSASTGEVTWTSTVKGGVAANDKFDDAFDNAGWPPAIWFEDGTEPTLTLATSKTTLAAGTDYTLGWDTSSNHDSAMHIVFLKAQTEDVVVTYKTMCDKSARTYSNTSRFTHGGIAHPATATYAIDAQSALTKSGSVSWDSTYDNGKGAWIAKWKVTANQRSDTQEYGLVDLDGKAVTITDALPADTTLVNTAAYPVTCTVRTNYYPNSIDGESLTGTKIGGTIAGTSTAPVFTIPTSEVIDAVATSTRKGKDYAYVELTYYTVLSKVPAGTSTRTNSVTGASGDLTFTPASSDVQVSDTVLSKSGTQRPDSELLDYTLTVNPHAEDLSASSDALTLTDTLDGDTTIVPSSFRIMDGTTDITGSCAISAAPATDADGKATTKLSITVPDSKSLIVTYSTKLNGAVGSWVSVKNAAALADVANSSTKTDTSYQVHTASGSASGTNDTLTLTKSDKGSITKVLSGATFQLHRVNLDGWTDGTTLDQVSSLADTETTGTTGTLTFKDTTIGASSTRMDLDTLYYYVETTAPSGYALDSTKHFVMLPGTDYATRLAQAEAHAEVGTPSGEGSVVAYDTKAASTDVNLTATKAIDGREFKQGDAFTLTMAAEGTNDTTGYTMPTTTTATTTATSGTTDALTFNAVAFTKAGTYKFDITETSAAPAGITNSAATSVATVTVSDDSAGGLTASVAYAGAGADGKTFTNTYADTVQATLKAAKALSTGGTPANEFSFTATATTDYGAAVTYSDNGATKALGTTPLTVTNSGADVTFPTLSFPAKEGTYTFDITEKATTSSSLYEKSSVTYTATVSVAKNATTQAYEATVTYRGSDGSTAATFVNTRKTSTLEVDKSVVGAGADTTQLFDFTLTFDGDYTSPISNDTDGGSTAVDFTKDTIGGVTVVTYRLNGGTNSKLVLAGVPVGAKYTAAETANASYFANSSWSHTESSTATDNVHAFANQIKTANLYVSKAVEGEHADAAREFTFDFTFKLKEGTNPLGEISYKVSDDGGKTYGDNTQTLTTKESEGTLSGSLMMHGGQVVEFVGLPVGGTVTYSVVEQADGLYTPNLTGPQTVDIKEGDADSGVKVNYVNTKNAPETNATWTPAATKTVDGAVPASAFEFGLSLLSEPSGASVTHGDPSTTLAVDSSVTGFNTTKSSDVSFDTLTFDKEGTYTFKMSEATASTATIAKDASTYTISVPVEYETYVEDDVTKDRLVVDSANITVSKDGIAQAANATPSFDNKSVAATSTTGKISVTKTLDGVAPAAGLFSFKLHRTSAPTDAPALVDRTAPNADDGAVSFGDINYTKAGTYVYQVIETTTSDSIACDTRAYTVTQTVELNEVTNALSVTGTTYAASATKDLAGQTSSTTAAAFANYSKPTTAVPQVTKTVSGSAASSFPTFTYQIAAVNGGPLPAKTTCTTQGAGTASFGNVTFAAAGTYKYTISEQRGQEEGWTYDPTTYTWTVTVALDAETGKLAATGALAKGDSVSAASVSFENKYETTAFTATKTWDDSSNAYGTRPASVSLQLMRNGVAYGDAATVTGTGDSWTHEWTGLPKSDADGNEYTYTVDEATVPAGYAKTVSGTTVTNKLVTAIVKFSKADASPNAKGTLLAGCTFHIESTNLTPKIDKTITTNADGTIVVEGSTASVAGLALPAGAYTLTETKAPANYEVHKGSQAFTVGTDGKVTTTADNLKATDDGVALEQTDAPVSTTSFTATKTWDDSSNVNGMRPASVTLQLMQNGVAYGDAVAVTGTGDTWTHEWTGLPNAIDGVTATYTVSETTVPTNYTAAVSTDGKTVTNTLNTHKVTVEKVSSTSVTTQLVGASLQILDSAGKVVDSWNTNGMVHVTSLPVGSYTLHEVSAPAGYAAAEDIAFEVASDGTVSSGGAALSAATVVMKDAPGSYTPTGFTPLVSRLYPTLASASLLTAATGDQTSLVLPICLGVAGLAIVGGALYLRKRHKDE